MIAKQWNRLLGIFMLVPHDLIALMARIGMGVIFLRSGLLKVDGWASGVTLALFEQEYKLPLIPPEIAAPLGMCSELLFGTLLIIGLATRLGALGILGMTLVIEIFVYPNAFDTHASWAACVLYLIRFGAGSFSLDWLIARSFKPMKPQMSS